jgi:hypothetical protein
VQQDRAGAAKKLIRSLGYEADLRIEGGRVRRMPASITDMTENSIYSFGQYQPQDQLVPVPELEALSGPARALLPDRFCVLDGRLHTKLSIDLHYTLNLLTEDVGTRVKPDEAVWWEDPQWIDVGTVRVGTLSDRVLSWVLLHRLYVDSMLLQETSIKSLCHVKLLWSRGRLDVPHIRHVARRYPYLAPSLHYALRAANELCALGLSALEDPVNLWGATAPTLNLGDCLPALLDFGFAFEPDRLDGDRFGDGRIAVRVF